MAVVPLGVDEDGRIQLGNRDETAKYSKGSNLETLLGRDGLAFRFDFWHPRLAEHTFSSRPCVIPFPLAEARALMKAHEHARLMLFVEMQEQGRRPDLEVRTQPAIDWDDLEPEHATALRSLEARLDAALTESQWTECGAFVRLSSRSPKDAVFAMPAFYELFEREMRARPDTSTENVIAFARALAHAQRVVSGADAMRMLVNSRRVYDDVSMAELTQQEAFNLHLVLRQWHDIDPELEFRAFVGRDGSMLTALTVYNPAVHVPWICENRERIAAAIQEFFERAIRPHFDGTRDPAVVVPAYVFDVVLDYNARVTLIEINNPPPVAGTALFDWDNPDDRARITNGPFEMRVLDVPPPRGIDELWWRGAAFIRRVRNVDEPRDTLHEGTSCARCRVAPIRGEMFTSVGPEPRVTLCFFCHDLRVHTPGATFTASGVFAGRDVGAEPASADDGEAPRAGRDVVDLEAPAPGLQTGQCVIL